LSQSRPTLGSILTKRIAFFAILAMFVQLAVVFSDYYWNVGELSRLFVEQESERLAAGIIVEDSGTRYLLPDNVHQRYDRGETGYIARIRSAGGAVIYRSCDTACEAHFLPVDVNPPDFWLRSLTSGKPLSLVGGRAFVVAGQRFLVDIASIGDPDDVMSEVLWNEVIEHLIVPMTILLVLVLGGTLLSVRQALRPVVAAANEADRIDPLDSRSHLDFDRMPREVAHLAHAVNRAFERVGELMKAQKVLTSGIAHEIRTPLAALKLELGHIDHPRARKAETDLDDLVNFVSQLTALARLDSVDHSMFEDIDLVELSSSVVEQLAPWVYENAHALEFSSQVEKASLRGAPSLLRDALRNLIENAVKHTPDRTLIVVHVGYGLIRVEDRHPKEVSHSRATTGSPDHLGIGLKIVGRIAEMHGARFSRAVAETGHVFELDFR